MFELWSFYLDHSEMGTMFSGIPTITFEASISIDVLDLLAIAGSSLLCDHQRQPRTSSHNAATCSSHAFGHLPLSQVFRPKSAGFSHPGTFAMVGSRRATASCTHKTWVWRCLTRHTPRLEAFAFDAVASTRTRGLTTFATSAAMATSPRAPEALLVNADMPAQHHVRRRSRRSGLRASRPVAV